MDLQLAATLCSAMFRDPTFLPLYQPHLYDVKVNPRLGYQHDGWKLHKVGIGYIEILFSLGFPIIFKFPIPELKSL